MLGIAGGIFSFSVFLLIDRIDSYYAYLARVSEEGDGSYSRVNDLWWVAGVWWHVLLFIVTSFLVHRYLANRRRSPFILWQIIGVMTLLGWLLTISTATGLECIMQGSAYPLERAADVFLTWFVVKFIAAVFACNVIYSSLIHSAVTQYPGLPVTLFNDESLSPASWQPSSLHRQPARKRHTG
jgi:hypothetical protein